MSEVPADALWSWVTDPPWTLVLALLITAAIVVAVGLVTLALDRRRR